MIFNNFCILVRTDDVIMIESMYYEIKNIMHRVYMRDFIRSIRKIIISK